MAIIESLNHLIWDNFLIYLIIFSSLFFTYSLRFIQIRRFFTAFKVLLTRNRKQEGQAIGISGFQALCTSLASRVGTGNIAGVAIALYMGGPGAIFWMWLLAFLGMATSFAECTLAQVYKVNGQGGIYRGGPSHYMKFGMGNHIMGIIFALCLIITYGFAFNSVQSHTIAQAFLHSFDVPTYVSGIFMGIISAIIILGGVKRIASLAQVLIPFMSLSYILVTSIVIILNYQHIPEVFSLIIKSAWGLEQAGSGLLGYTMLNAMIYGGKRGLFSNEAGMGSSPNIAAAADGKHPVVQGYLQMLGPFFDTIIICSCTAFIILFSDQLMPGSGISGVELTQKALISQVGNWGGIFITFILFWFIFTTLIGNYSYAEMSLIFLKPSISKPTLVLFRVLALLVIVLAPLQEMNIIWSSADLTMGIMTFLNLIAILSLSGEVTLLSKDYEESAQSNIEPEFNLNKYPELSKKINSSVWRK